MVRKRLAQWRMAYNASGATDRRKAASAIISDQLI
jgi:hypothetical protein